MLLLIAGVVFILFFWNWNNTPEKTKSKSFSETLILLLIGLTLLTAAQFLGNQFALLIFSPKALLFLFLSVGSISIHFRLESNH
jgi:hypothetical protein